MLSIPNDEESEFMYKILVGYYSSYGHVEAMARAQAEGCARVAGVEVSVKRVPELMPLEVAKAAGCKPSIAVRIAEGHHCLHRLWHEVSAARNRGRQNGGDGRKSPDSSSRNSESRNSELSNSELKKAPVNPPPHSELRQRIVACMQAASMEITPAEQDHLPALRGLLSKGSAVYISHVPSVTLAQVVRTAQAVQAAGFKATPHIAARRITYPENLRAALAELTASGVEQVLLVAGDATHPAGEFDSTLDVFASGILEKSALKSIGVAGYPEGQRGIGPMLLWNALKMKQAFADRTGLAVYIVTQFGFNGNALRDWEPELARHDVRLPIHAGIAGPTPLSKLIKFAMRCGIGASLRTVMRNLSAVSGGSELATTPDQHVLRLMQLPSSTRVVAPHFFSFGSALETAHWIERVVSGDFVIEPAEGRFLVGAARAGMQ